MDIRQLNYFISVADHLNFTKAAQHHFIAQTAISQQVMALEQQLDVKLFYRNNRSVQLTPAGKIFYREAKLIVARSQEAIKKTQQAASGFEGTLKIGFMGPYEKRFLPELIRNFRRTYPTIDLTISLDNIETLREAVEHGLLDIAFNISKGIEKTPGLTWKSLHRDQLCVIMYRDHPFANEPKIRRSALAHESFVAIDRKEASGPFDAMIQECVDSGFSPTIVGQARHIESVIFMVEAEIGIALLPRCYELYDYNVRFIELEGENEFIEFGVVWMKDNLNPAIPLFLKALEDQMSSSI